MDYLEGKDCPTFGNFLKFCNSFYKQIKEEKHVITIYIYKYIFDKIQQSLLINTGYKIITKITLLFFILLITNKK